MYEYLGKKVMCDSYLRKVKDGMYIECYTEDGNICSPGERISSACVMKNGKNIKDIAFEGDGEVKTLYELTEKKFIGVCVGEKTIITKELLFGDVGEEPMTGSEFFYIGKEPTEIIDCYIVYYANNKKKYVPKKLCSFV